MMKTSSWRPPFRCLSIDPFHEFPIGIYAEKGRQRSAGKTHAFGDTPARGFFFHGTEERCFKEPGLSTVGLGTKEECPAPNP